MENNIRKPDKVKREQLLPPRNNRFYKLPHSPLPSFPSFPVLPVLEQEQEQDIEAVLKKTEEEELERIMSESLREYTELERIMSESLREYTELQKKEENQRITEMNPFKIRVDKLNLQKQTDNMVSILNQMIHNYIFNETHYISMTTEEENKIKEWMNELYTKPILRERKPAITKEIYNVIMSYF